MTVNGLIGVISAIFAKAIGWVGSVVDTVSNEPLLLLFAVIGLVGLGIGLFHRLKG